MTHPKSPGTDVRRHALLADMAEQTALLLIEKHGIAEEAAADVGNRLADFFAEHWRGQNIYLPADQEYRLNRRDWEIFERMQRGTAPDLAREFGVSEVRIYQIFRRCLAEYRARTQHSLFSDEPVTEGNKE